MPKLRSAGLALSLVFFMSACAHRYYYSPEIKGAGAMKKSEAAIDYQIPPSGVTELRLRIRSMGTEEVRGQKMFVVRMAYARPKEAKVVPSSREFIRPNEQTLQLGLGHQSQIKPAYIYTKSRNTDVIELTGHNQGAMDLLFPIPKADSGPLDMERIILDWKVHYANQKIESQTTRFDRYDAAPQQSAEPFPEDPDYPYDVSPLIQPGWDLNPDPFWWPMIW